MIGDYLGFGSNILFGVVILTFIILALNLFSKGVRQRSEDAWHRRLGQLSVSRRQDQIPLLDTKKAGWLGYLVSFAFPKAATDRLVGELLVQADQGRDSKLLDYKMALSFWSLDPGRLQFYLAFGRALGIVIAVLAFLIISEMGALFVMGSVEWILSLLVFGALGTLFPNFLAHVVLAKKRDEIESMAPDVIDLLMLSVESGMTFDNALLETKAALALYSENMSLELDRFSADLAVLPNRSDAFANLIARTGSNTLRYLSTALAQGDKYGTPIAASLRIVAAESRKHRLIRMEKKAAKLPVFLSIPLMIFILPPVIVVSAGPGFVVLMRSFGGVG